MTTSDVGETDFAIIIYREEDHWEADALPAAVTADGRTSASHWSSSR